MKLTASGPHSGPTAIVSASRPARAWVMPIRRAPTQTATSPTKPSAAVSTWSAPMSRRSSVATGSAEDELADEAHRHPVVERQPTGVDPAELGHEVGPVVAPWDTERVAVRRDRERHHEPDRGDRQRPNRLWARPVERPLRASRAAVCIGSRLVRRARSPPGAAVCRRDGSPRRAAEGTRRPRTGARPTQRATQSGGGGRVSVKFPDFGGPPAVVGQVCLWCARPHRYTA